MLHSSASTPDTDVLIIGSGLAGLFAALTLASGARGPRPRVTVLTLGTPGSLAASAWAQGGIAAALGPDDSPAQHAADTIAAGAGIVDEAIARLVAEDVPARVMELARLGVPFDRYEDGRFALGREAAHGHCRIAKVTGDKAGATITATLARAAENTPSIRLLNGISAFDLLRDGEGRIGGVLAARGEDILTLRAAHVVLATGGAGALYATATTPLSLLGTGLGMAARAGASVADAEFVQFHPTAMVLDRDPAPLATEALRGEGAVLITQSGDRFMPAVHQDAELAPRDVVARAIHQRLMRGERVFLDTRTAIGAAMPTAFPTVTGLCRAAGIDPVREAIPVAPAAHYHMGGVAVDADGRTTLPGLWACGEVASTGLHGANRLASNSLAEAVVMGARVARAILSTDQSPTAAVAPVDAQARPRTLSSPLVYRLRQTMTREAGLIRSHDSLARAATTLATLAPALDAAGLANVRATATLILAGAAQRTESRGGHFRSDYPTAHPVWQRRSVTTLDTAQTVLDALTVAAPPAAQPSKAQS